MGYLPSAWRQSTVTPIFKKGDKLKAENYRPISLTSVVVKVLERVISKQVLQFALRESIIPPQQHGFVPGRSIITNLLTCLNDWTKSLDAGIPMDVVYLDFAKAFDRVPRRRLLHKLEHFGIRGSLLKFIDAFLTDRSFSVRVGNMSSSMKSVLSGVPQGSVLGPLLFILYVSDLQPLLSSPSASYADDIKLYNRSECHRSLQSELDFLVKWCLDWLLPLNIPKCRVLYLGNNNPKRPYFIDGVPLDGCLSHVDLGVVVSSDLSWSPHILHICNKAKQRLYMIQQCFRGGHPDVVAALYKAYIRPILEFAGPVWHPWLQRDAQMLEFLQRRVTRLPYGVQRPSYQDRLSIMCLDTFADRKHRGDMIVTFRALNGFFGSDLSHLFELNTNHLRGHNLKLARERFHTRSRENFLSNRVFACWNQLTPDIVGAPSVNVFKNRFDVWKSRVLE